MFLIEDIQNSNPYSQLKKKTTNRYELPIEIHQIRPFVNLEGRGGANPNNCVGFGYNQLTTKFSWSFEWCNQQ